MGERIIYVFGEPSRVSIDLEQFPNDKGYYKGKFIASTYREALFGVKIIHDIEAYRSICLKYGKRLLLSDGYFEQLEGIVDGYVEGGYVFIKNLSLFKDQKDCFGDVLTVKDARRRMHVNDKAVVTKIEESNEDVKVLTVQYPFSVRVLKREGTNALVQILESTYGEANAKVLREDKKIRLAISKGIHKLPRNLYDFNLAKRTMAYHYTFVVKDIDSLFRDIREQDDTNLNALYKSVTYSAKGDFIKRDDIRVYVYDELAVPDQGSSIKNCKTLLIAETSREIAGLLKLDCYIDNGQIKTLTKKNMSQYCDESSYGNIKNMPRECLILKKGKLVPDKACGGKDYSSKPIGESSKLKQLVSGLGSQSGFVNPVYKEIEENMDIRVKFSNNNLETEIELLSYDSDGKILKGQNLFVLDRRGKGFIIEIKILDRQLGIVYDESEYEYDQRRYITYDESEYESDGYYLDVTFKSASGEILFSNDFSIFIKCNEYRLELESRFLGLDRVQEKTILDIARLFDVMQAKKFFDYEIIE